MGNPGWCRWFAGCTTHQIASLVGGWTNPFEKYARQIGSFPQGSGWTKKNIWNHLDQGFQVMKLQHFSVNIRVHLVPRKGREFWLSWTHAGKYPQSFLLKYEPLGSIMHTHQTYSNRVNVIFMFFFGKPLMGPLECALQAESPERIQSLFKKSIKITKIKPQIWRHSYRMVCKNPCRGYISYIDRGTCETIVCWKTIITGEFKGFWMVFGLVDWNSMDVFSMDLRDVLMKTTHSPPRKMAKPVYPQQTPSPG